MRGSRMLARGRSLKRSLMRTECVVERDTGEFATDPVTFERVPVMEPIYSGLCQVRSSRGAGSTSEVPGLVVTKQVFTVDLPIGVAGTADVMTNDVWTCTANVEDPASVGRTARVTGVDVETLGVARRIPVEEVS